MRSDDLLREAEISEKTSTAMKADSHEQDKNDIFMTSSAGVAILDCTGRI